jgi:flagellar basal-body rod protein FlgB
MSGIIGVLQFAVDGLSQQQQAIADNLSNSSTPGFTAQDVNFQSSLAQALASPGGGTAQVSTTADPAPYATDGNNVDTPTQLVAAEQTTLQYQTMVEMLNAQFALVQNATTA